MTLNSDIKKFTHLFKCWFPTLFKILVQMKDMLIPVSTHCTSLMPRMKIYELSTLYSLLSVFHQPVAKSEHNIALHTHSRLYKIITKTCDLSCDSCFFSLFMIVTFSSRMLIISASLRLCNIKYCSTSCYTQQFTHWTSITFRHKFPHCHPDNWYPIFRIPR